MTEKTWKDHLMLLNVNTLSAKDCSVCTVSGVDVLAAYEDGTFLVRPSSVVLAVGTARKNPEDKPNNVIGFELATGRAITKLGKNMIKRGNGLVKHVDDMQNLKSEHEQEEIKYILELQEMYSKMLSSAELVTSFVKNLGAKLIKEKME